MRLFAVILASLLAAACANGSSTTTPTQTVVHARYQGSWSGQTSQAKQVTFTVIDNLVSAYRFDYDVSTSECSGGGGVGGTLVGGGGASPMAAIVNDTFTISFPFLAGSSSPAWTLTGTFTSNTSASGTLDVSASALFTPSCMVLVHTPWTAQKAP